MDDNDDTARFLHGLNAVVSSGKLMKHAPRSMKMVLEWHDIAPGGDGGTPVSIGVAVNVDEIGTWIAQNGRYNVFCWGETPGEMIDALYEQIAFLRDAFYLEDSTGLDQNAINLKARLADIFG